MCWLVSFFARTFSMSLIIQMCCTLYIMTVCRARPQGHCFHPWCQQGITLLHQELPACLAAMLRQAVLHPVSRQLQIWACTPHSQTLVSIQWRQPQWHPWTQPLRHRRDQALCPNYSEWFLPYATRSISRIRRLPVHRHAHAYSHSQANLSLGVINVSYCLPTRYSLVSTLCLLLLGTYSLGEERVGFSRRINNLGHAMHIKNKSPTVLWWPYRWTGQSPTGKISLHPNWYQPVQMMCRQVSRWSYACSSYACAVWIINEFINPCWYLRMTCMFERKHQLQLKCECVMIVCNNCLYRYTV